jgi:hypothetical protein
MTALRHAAPAVLAAVVAVFSGGLDRAQAGAGAVAALSYRTPKPLSPWDAQIYASAFDAAARGDFVTARKEAGRVSDKALLGHLDQRRLLSNSHQASFEELRAWLEDNAGLAGADRIYALAKKRQPEGGPEPKAPLFRAPHSWTQLQAGPLGPRTPDRGQPARDLFYRGETKAAYDMAVSLDERWIAGLAAFRLKNYAEAQTRFDRLARDTRENEWIRSGAAYWAARAAIAGGSPELAPDFLRMAAAHPLTFYGLIAERQLGLEPTVQEVQIDDPIGDRLVHASFDGQMDLDRLVREDERARRAAALAQIGQMGEASVEIRSALTFRPLGRRAPAVDRPGDGAERAAGHAAGAARHRRLPDARAQSARRLQPRSRPGLRHRAPGKPLRPGRAQPRRRHGADAADAGRPRPTSPATTG